MHNRHEVWGIREPGIDIEAEQARWMELAKPAEEGHVGGVAEPTLADDCGADEAGGAAEADHDLDEEIIVVQHLGDGVGRRRRIPQPP